ncbi:CDP-alcohol phosphatidyltransferase-domain-containing protein [Zychaea mexicana]|uniref:CDP-alcohol phosphatidyltransferase-domain-containing protein n=1 Tax=Zychaea mexicana TaxID=64656 RepID=UPI0022FDFAB3|nr:CDP-alcohol phosphatidyltransferase-domain-containing protein [Zychaea mexicana]KAI9496956.1 CDP-alcohol phosphatidyltransferase-domain-containing protein [Zychaea mexicana]
MTYIPTEALPNLHKYKYGSVDKSLVSRYILSVYWNNLVKIFPLWVAPNLITLLGLMCIIVNVATLYYYSPDLGPCPNWVYTTFGIGLFLYQSLDAIDGKQARRTGMSGPLGELFDHGCDALNTTLGVLTWASATSLGQSWWTVVSLMASLGNFYLSTWEEYHTGVLFLGYFNGPTEGVLMLVGVHLISGCFGPAFWTLRVSELLGPVLSWEDHPLTRIVGGLQLNHVLIVIGAVVMVLNIVAGLVNVIAVKITPTEFSHPDRSIRKALFGLFPFIYMVAATYTWLRLWPSIVNEHLALFIPLVGLLFGHQVGLMITSHVAKLDFPYWNSTVNVLLTAGCVLAYLDVSLESPLAISQSAALKSFLIAAGIQYGSFVMGVINEICKYLNIGCLTVRKLKQPSKN